MYLDFFGLSALPFELTPNPRFLFMTPRHREGLSTLQYGLSTAKAVTVLIGEAGTGKTTLLRAAFESDMCRHVQCTYISNPALTRDEFIDMLARRFGLSAEAGRSKAVLLAELEERLLGAGRDATGHALVIDEAQRLSEELLEEVRLLANIETADRKLLPLVLAGQPELGARLDESGLRQLKQRVSLRCVIAPFTLAEAAAYIAHRVHLAGGEAPRLFTREAIGLIHSRSRGIPRSINVICDNALLSGFAQGARPIGRALVAEVCRDLDFHAPDDEAAEDAPVAVEPAPAPVPIVDAAPPAPPAAADPGYEDFTPRRRTRLFGMFPLGRRSEA